MSMSSNEQDAFKRRHWLYLGGEKGYNLVHRVCDVDTTTDPKMPYLTTWSLPEQETEEDVGWTWHGPLSLFRNSFKPLGPADEAMA
jgi:hypothetical protein